MVTDGRITFPAHLFDELLVQQLSRSFCAAVSCAGAKDARAELNVLTDTEAVVRVSWNA